MTDREKAIVMAYTGYCMLAGDKLSVFYEYVESIMGRPVYTHEMGTKVVDNLIKEKARPDFIALCAEQEPKTGHWIGDKCSKCGNERAWYGDNPDYCPDCGAKMQNNER